MKISDKEKNIIITEVVDNFTQDYLGNKDIKPKDVILFISEKISDLIAMRLFRDYEGAKNETI